MQEFCTRGGYTRPRAYSNINNWSTNVNARARARARAKAKAKAKARAKARARARAKAKARTEALESPNSTNSIIKIQVSYTGRCADYIGITSSYYFRGVSSSY